MSRRHGQLAEVLDSHGYTLIFKLGGGKTATVVCWDFTSAISVVVESSSSITVAGEASDELGLGTDEGERKIVETRFMAIFEERWWLEGFRGKDWRQRGFLYSGVETGGMGGVY